jgi:hypothetical protein
MRSFDRTEQGDTESGVEASARLEEFTPALWTALVPKLGSCCSIQGELVRANRRLLNEQLQNGLYNYYDHEQQGTADSFGQNNYGRLLLFLLDTLIANRGDALSSEDVGYFERFRELAMIDWKNRPRRLALEPRFLSDLMSTEERRQYGSLCMESYGFDVEDLYDHAQRCIANWCLANPELIDMEGRPVTEGGLSSLVPLIQQFENRGL